MKICQVGAELIRPNCGQKGMTELVGTFRNFENAPNCYHHGIMTAADLQPLGLAAG
jgi:hypothetical protein